MNSKPTDKHQYLVISSCHPHHAKRSIPYSLALRLRRIFSSHDSYIQLTNELINYLTNRGYDKAFLTTQIQRASDVPRADALKDKPPTQTETTPFCYLLHITLTLPPECRAHYSQTFPRPLLLRTL